MLMQPMETGIISDLGYDVREQVRSSSIPASGFDLGGHELRGQGGRADILLRIFKRHSRRQRIGSMVDEAELGLAGPG